VRYCLLILAVVLLAGTATSPADIIHTSTDFLLGDIWQGSEAFDLDLDANGSVDFSLSASMNNISGISSANPDTNRYLIHLSPPPNIGGPVAALNSGYVINSNSGGSTPEEWFGLEGMDTFIIIFNTGISGEFYNHRGFVGLTFESTNRTHYGWLDIEGMSSSSQIRVRGWAYESTPGVGIVAGAVPEPSSVALFAIGAVGAWILRKEKSLTRAFTLSLAPPAQSDADRQRKRK